MQIGLLCRFRTAAEQKKTIEGLKKGTVDIVIGTHRLLSKDVGFKDLGLLIIDEEQRFGVGHKEKIKKMKETVDVMSLSATPIPRTLHMSLIGIRDMSVLEEAPMERQPIQTFVFEYNEEMIREAIARNFPGADRCTMCSIGFSRSGRWPRRFRAWCPRQMWLTPTGGWRRLSWNGSCTILSIRRSMFWCPPPSSRSAWTFPT